MVGFSLLPIDSCPHDTDTCSPEANKAPFDKATMMIGCHKTQADTDLGQHSGGVFDEVAFWNKSIPDDNIHMLLGGWKESFDQVQGVPKLGHF